MLPLIHLSDFPLRIWIFLDLFLDDSEDLDMVI